MKHTFKALLATTLLSMPVVCCAVDETTETSSSEYILRMAEAAFRDPQGYSRGQELLTEAYSRTLSDVERAIDNGSDVSASMKQLNLLIEDSRGNDIDPLASAAKYLAKGNTQMARTLWGLAQNWAGLWDQTNGEMRALLFSQTLSSQIELHENINTLINNPNDRETRDKIIQLATNPHILIHDVLVVAHKLYESKNCEAAERLLVMVVLNTRHDDATQDQISYAFMLRGKIAEFILKSGDYMFRLIAEIYEAPFSGNVEQLKKQLIDCIGDRGVSVDRVLEIAMQISKIHGDHITASKLLWRFQYENREPETTQAQLWQMVMLRSELNKAVEKSRENKLPDLER